MKKILVIFLMFVLLATSVTAITTNTEKEEKNEANNCEECDQINYKTYDNEDCECKYDKYIAGYPVKAFPPKTKEELALIDPNPQPTMSFSDLPPQFSWKNYGGDWTTGARDQGNCGSCWDFSALAAMEAAINIASGSASTDIDLSEQYVLSCLSGAGSCSGGWMSTAIEYIQSETPGSTGNGINGVCVEGCMPYTATDSVPCSSKCTDWDTYSEKPTTSDKLFQILDYGVTTTSEDNPSDWNLLKTWIITYGPLSVDIVADGFGSWGNSHHSSTDVYQNDNNGWTNHGVLLVGWVDDSQILNGGYWIIKNSWGSGWGYGGFGNIAYGCNGVATRDCVWVTTPPWETGGNNGGPIDIDMAIFADFHFQTDEGLQFPHLGEEIEFYDTSQGNVATREWDFNGDGIIDDDDDRPTYVYTQEGNYEVTLTVTNQWGLSSNITRIIGVYEVWPPIVKITPEEYPDPDRPDNDLIIHFDGRYSYDPDKGTIVEYNWDFGDGTTGTGRHLEHEFPEPDEIYEVTLTLIDNDGGESSGTCIVKIDQNVPPETSIHHGYGSDGSEWYSETQRLSFSATDWTRVLYTYYRIDGGEWIRYIPEEQSLIPVGSEGMHTVEAYSIDYYHNEETPVSETFGIDKTKPTINVNLQGDMVQGQYITPVTVTITGEDGLSGIDKFTYQIMGKTQFMDYTGPFEVTEQCHIHCVSIDKAGNKAEEIMQVPIEGPPTSLTIKGPGRGQPGVPLQFTVRSVDVSPTSEDNIFYYIDWGDGNVEEWIGPYDSFEEITVEHIYNEDAQYTVTVKAKDQLGAESEEVTLSISIPKTKNKMPNIFTLFERILDRLPILKTIIIFLQQF